MAPGRYLTIMNLEKCNQWLSLFSNLGVLIGIFFLVIEISQNNELLRAQAAYNFMEIRLNDREQILYNPEYAELSYKAFNGNSLTAVENYRIGNLIQTTLIELEYEFGQMLDGNLPVDKEDLKIKWRASFGEGLMSRDGLWGEAFQELWPNFRGSLREDFATFWENEVMSGN